MKRTVCCCATLAVVLMSGCQAMAARPSVEHVRTPDQLPVPETDLDATVVFLVRHAEKTPEGDYANLIADPDRRGVGVGRAEFLAELLASTGISAVYSTQYCRTAQTAQPAARLLDTSIQLEQSDLDLSKCRPAISVETQPLPAEIDTAAEVAEHVLSNQAGGRLLIVGHSNTVPNLVEAFGAPSLCPEPFEKRPDGECHIPYGEFHHLFTVVIQNEGSSRTVHHQTYGHLP